MNTLLNQMSYTTSLGLTQNNALTHTNSGSALLNFYAQAGAMRAKKEEALQLFIKAFSEDRLGAIRILFYLRDIHGGQGERDLFRTCLIWIAVEFPNIFNQLISFVPEYGRWDDLFVVDTPETFAHIKAQILSDYSSDKPSLLAKWLPTINASSNNTKNEAYRMLRGLKMRPIDYRRVVRSIRKKIRTVEELMSTNQWSEINYSAVPSKAAKIYRKAFPKHDAIRYQEYLNSVEKGEKKINAATLYPYEIYNAVNQDRDNQTLNLLWNALPDYTRGNNALVVADVSGSMLTGNGPPMSVSVSLALYFAERNRGQFKDHFITFSGSPVLQKIQGKTLFEKMLSIESSAWGMNTDLEKVFQLILDSAVKGKVPPEEMPSTLYIISDMEFDRCISGKTLHQDMKDKYQAAGYQVPSVVFWNVNASGHNLPVRQNEQNVTLVSGFSPVIFKMTVENKTPIELMWATISSERYSRIVI